MGNFMPVQNAGEGAGQSTVNVINDRENEDMYLKLEKTERYIKKMEERHSQELSGLRDQLRKITSREREGLEAIRRFR